MKKFGFTLAEVLITLGIVGVVSALTIPTFTTQMQMSKIGPRLAKAVASFEQASKAALDDNNSDRLTMSYSSGDSLNVGNFMTDLGNHLKGGVASSQRGILYRGTDGVDYWIEDRCVFQTQSLLPHTRRVCTNFGIDINGENAGPNRASRDMFYFQLMDDGSLRAYGGSWNTGNVWTTTCPKNQKPAAGNEMYCTGHIMENGLKAEYK